MMRRVVILCVFVLLQVATAQAADLIMVRSQQKFPEAMLTLQSSVAAHGYTVTRVQRIDVGLTGMGYDTDKYRVVFVARPDEMHYLTQKYPDLIPYMPPQVVIFAENEETVLVTANPGLLMNMIGDERDKMIFRRWQNDIQAVFDDIRNAD